MKRFLTFIIMVLWLVVGYSQDQTQYNHYIANQGLLNPAYNGTRDVMSGIMVHRSDMIGFKGGSMNQAINVHGPVENTNLGVGFWMANDNIGLSNTTDFFGAASYKFKVDRRQFVSLGLQLGVSSLIVDGTKAEINDPDDPIYLGKENYINMNIGFGAYYYGKDYFGGFSIPKFWSNKLDNSSLDYKNVFSGKDIHAYLYGGYVFEWGDVMVKPTMISKFVYGAPLEFDITGNFLFVERLWLGLSYRTTSNLVFLTEYIIDRRFTVRYSFDYALNGYNRFAKYGAHELSLQFDFTFGRRPGMRSIRYF